MIDPAYNIDPDQPIVPEPISDGDGIHDLIAVVFMILIAGLYVIWEMNNG